MIIQFELLPITTNQRLSDIKHCRLKLLFLVLIMITKEKKYISPDEYLKLERLSSVKNEYYKGEIFAMSGASYNHNVITTNILSTLHSKLRDTKYMPFGSDMRMYVSENGLFTYPDISVYESDVKVYDKEEDTVLYPVVIIEVLSEATQGYDRSDKFRLYRDISSLKDYILASQDEIAVEHFTKQSDGKWLLNEIKEKNGKVILDSINVTLDINDFYYKIKF